LTKSIGTPPFTDSTPLIVTLMTLAFFGKGVAALGWAFATDMAPKEANSVSAAIMPPSRPPSLPRFRRP
jgi:ACS family glucarate transporter-like MFS transporter